MLTRMFAYFTLFSYLLVGSLAVRFLQAQVITLTLPTQYFSYFSAYKISTAKEEIIASPQLAFSKIKFPGENKVLNTAVLRMEKVAGIKLNFQESIKISPVLLNNHLPENLVALFSELREELLAETTPVVDKVSTKLSASSEPEFFDYTEVTSDEKKPVEQEAQEVAQIQKSETQEASQISSPENIVEEIPIDELIGFDYSRASADAKSQSLPTVTKVTTPVVRSAVIKKSAPIKWEVSHPKTSPKSKVTTQEEANPLVAGSEKSSGLTTQAAPLYQNRVTIQVTGTDFIENREEVGFEVRFQDDYKDSFNDYNNGSVTIDHDLAQSKMTRSMVVLKRGYIPTNTDLILEEGVSEVVIPLVEESTFNDLLAPYGSRGAIGAVLVELDKASLGASLDVPYSQLLRLDAELKITQEDNYVYELFVGVQAGNAMLSYKTRKGEDVSKIIHVHEHELTFETNFFENPQTLTLSLFEEDLLSKERTPLIISSQEVKKFASKDLSSKHNDHTYMLHFEKSLLGGRKYLELSHQREPIFVGLKDHKSLVIPSENFMRYLLSRFEGGRLGSRCMIQVNLSKKALSYEVASESVGQSLVTYPQVLDADGKFYDSVGPKSRKIIIVGENQGPQNLNPDSKVNIKIVYEDGTTDFIGTYCSPNTYLVEQL